MDAQRNPVQAASAPSAAPKPRARAGKKSARLAKKNGLVISRPRMRRVLKHALKEYTAKGLGLAHEASDLAHVYLEHKLIKLVRGAVISSQNEFARRGDPGDLKTKPVRPHDFDLVARLAAV